MDERLSVGSLFSGIGGIELGFERAGGFKTEWFVERDIYCQFVLKKHWPQAIVYDDVTTLDFAAVPKIDILTGGFPCQDISNAGKRAGITGSRSSLWKHFCRAIGILRPKYALIENVSALANRGLDVVLADLAEIGYAAEWYNISASSVGAPHRRERLFILAYPNSSRHIHRQAQELSTQKREQTLNQSFSGSSDVENSFSDRFAERRSQESSDESDGRRNTSGEWTSKTNNSGNASSHVADASSRESGKQEARNRRESSIGGSEEICYGIWAVEPSVGRVAHGIPCRMDRIKCLGNAVVPQVAQVFAEAIKAREREK